MRKKLFVGLLAGLLVVGCKNQSYKEKHQENQDSVRVNVREYSVQAVMWQQNAAEYRALCYQAFNLAKIRLDHYLKTRDTTGKNLAIITDIDETVLNNSPYEAELIKENKQYTANTWDDWVKKESAQPVPGAADFLNYAKQKGVAVFYVSNRLQGQIQATIANMKKVNFPYADADHLLFREGSSAKKERFEQVEKQHEVILFLGDNLSDFSSQYRAPSTEKRNALAKQMKEKFGKKFIVLPNPMYGDWESKGIYQGKYSWSESQKDSLRRASLKGY